MRALSTNVGSRGGFNSLSAATIRPTRTLSYVMVSTIKTAVELAKVVNLKV